MAGKTSKASTQPPGEALSPKHEAFVQAHVSNGMNATGAYKAVYPKYGSEKAAGANAARLIGNDRIHEEFFATIGSEKAPHARSRRLY